jgi:ribonuclease T
MQLACKLYQMDRVNGDPIWVTMGASSSIAGAGSTNTMNETKTPPETFISIDVETAGPFPGRYALLSIGACTVAENPSTFYVELKPDRQESQAEAVAISQLSLEDLNEHGLEPKEAMQRFADWLDERVSPGLRPIFAAFNAPFDWMFINDYFFRYLGYNPFGHSALDIKSYFMGQADVAWSQTSMREVGLRYLGKRQLAHNALQDALDQAKIFRRMLDHGHQQSG